MSEPPRKAAKMMQNGACTTTNDETNHMVMNGKPSNESEMKSINSECAEVVSTTNGESIHNYSNASCGPDELPGSGTATVLKFKKLTDKAITPTRGSKNAAGFDLYSAKCVTIPARGKALVPTDISIALPDESYGRIAPRSSLAWKHHIDVGAGVIDMDYRGPVGVVLFNLGESDYKVEEGDRIAQLIVERIFMSKIEEVEVLPSTERGAGGYGSTGK